MKSKKFKKTKGLQKLHLSKETIVNGDGQSCTAIDQMDSDHCTAGSACPKPPPVY
jgi:hypothetical protein